MASLARKRVAEGSWRNWSGAVRAAPRRLLYPQSEAELANSLAGATGPVRVAGSGHSFAPLCATDGTLFSLDLLSGVVGVDKANARATVRAGSKIHALGRPLYDEGVAFKNQGDIDRQAIAGAVSTGTHGTGATLRNFSAEVVSLRLVTPSGGAIEARADLNPEIFEAARLSLGALGILSELTFQMRKVYKLKEENRIITVDELFGQLPALRDKHRHVEFFWFPYTDLAVLKTLDETDEAAPEPRSSADMARRGEAVSSDQRIFRIGCRIVRLLPSTAPHAQRIFTRGMAASTRVRWSHEAFPSPRTVEFNEMEYAVPADRGLDCIREIVAELRSKKISTAFPLEFRFVKGDDVWLSPFYRRDSVTIAVHQYFSQDHQKLFAMAERLFRLYEGRPHWGKIHTRTASELRALYPRFDDFCRVRKELDPSGKMLNPYLKALLGA